MKEDPPKYLLVVSSSAKPGREEEYNEWYDRTHIFDVQKVPGIVSGRRFEIAPDSPAKPQNKYLALYEIDAENPGAVVEELLRRAGSEAMPISDALDLSSAADLQLFRRR